jgi:hypothetical protein
VIEEPLRDPRRLGDVVDAELVVAVVAKQLQPQLQQLAAALVDPEAGALADIAGTGWHGRGG